MRRRIVLAAVAVIATALLAFAIPLAVAVRNLEVSRALDELQAQTEQVAVFIDDRARTCGDIDLILTAASRERQASLSLFGLDGTLLAAPAGPLPTSGSELVIARSGAAGRRHGQGMLAVAVPLSTTACLQRLILHAEQPDAAAVAAVHRAWILLFLVGLVVLGLAALAASFVASRLARPLRDLASSAGRLGEGDFSVRVPRSGMPEVDAIASTLDATAERLGRAVERGRAFAADASHQLRTPLTAVRLHLEALETQGVEPDTVAALQAETDRLEATITELVALTDLGVTEETIEPADLVAELVGGYDATASAAGRTVTLEAVAAPPVRVRPGAVRQALQVLLDNALAHGVGAVQVTVAPTLPDQPERGTRICVVDEGPGLPAGVAAALRERDRGGGPLPLHGGRGLHLARVLVEGEGGRLTATDDGGTRVCIVLPAAPDVS